MALAPQFVTHRIGSPSARHQLELFLDLVCPFSKKQLNGVRQHVIPLIRSNPTVAESLQIIVRQVPQPWHASSTTVHEAVLAVSRAATGGDDKSAYEKPEVVEQFQKFFFALIDAQGEYFDEAVQDETVNQTKERLAKFAVDTVGIDKQKFIDAIKVGKGNSGNAVGADLKLQVKYHRQNSVHVTPTVALDGLIDPSVSSSFGEEEWKKYLQEKVLPTGSAKL